MLVIKSTERSVATSRGKLPVNSFGYAFCYDLPEPGEWFKIGRDTITLPYSRPCLYDCGTDGFRDFTDWEKGYVEFRELTHEQKLAKLDDDPSMARFLIGVR